MSQPNEERKIMKNLSCEGDLRSKIMRSIQTGKILISSSPGGNLFVNRNLMAGRQLDDSIIKENQGK